MCIGDDVCGLATDANDEQGNGEPNKEPWVCRCEGGVGEDVLV
jgi:hypothetical protein